MKDAKKIIQDYSILIGFILLCIIASLASNVFLTPQNIINILRQSSIIGVISIGMTFVILAGGIDLSVGSSLALIGGISLITQNSTNSVALGIITSILLGILIGIFNGAISTYGKIPPFVVTLGSMAIARSLILYIANGGSISGNLERFEAFANSYFFFIPTPVIIFVLITLIGFFVLEQTPFGRYVYAIGGNERAARLSAINTSLMKVIIYSICGLSVSIASLIETSRLNSISASSSGVSYELDAIAAVIIGGTSLSGGKGKVIGTFIGAILLATINNIMNLINVSPYLQGLVKGIIIIIVALLQKKTSNE
ncbi:ABC transporter permease [Caldicellulosiruptoraceae bacterium PP1]